MVLISRAVTVKSRVTPALRARLGAETQKAIRDVDEEIERAAAEIERCRASGRNDEAAALERKAQELSARKDALVAKLKEIARLREGQEVVRGQIQGFCEVKVGDNWPEVLSAEIVLEDGRVVAFREGGSVTVKMASDNQLTGTPEQ